METSPLTPKGVLSRRTDGGIEFRKGMMKKTYVYDESEVGSIAQKLAELMDRYQTFTFTGPLGAGKTTLIQALLKECGVSQPVTSPTFTYLNVYENDRDQLFYHFDLYRIPSMNDFQAAGFDEYLSAPNSWTFIEWPAVIMPLLKDNMCHCELDYVDNKRKIVVRGT
jgi:tRNA threonylcarbamoyladenosine biosynthesis protein TsaE